MLFQILTPDDCRQQNLSLSEANVCRPYLDSNVFLTWHSAENFAEYCLAYIFSARDFGDGTLGLAWIGSIAPSKLISDMSHGCDDSCFADSRGGICERPVRDIFEGQRIIKTLNTGMITIINHHFRTSALMTELTFAHEVGHSLGAEVSPHGTIHAHNIGFSAARRGNVCGRQQVRTLHHVSASDDWFGRQQQQVFELQSGEDGPRGHWREESAARQSELPNRWVVERAVTDVKRLLSFRMFASGILRQSRCRRW